ncbi:hypothetical protein BI023_gp41 [Mycobacterium phage Sneeze]|uniref:Uncharacterized protein n=1 Tax=Mycobacterium phage Rabbs TaxID=2530143 RepID=A0A481VT53_9CAUD|nr:hypothetical protein BI023_gp41 [Mycobacterium phage Sneeze]YP_010051386.1 hypothetical protein KDW71_gp41 [Mycobacterium phage Rabbs]ANU79751.1 hypothetical protein SEA_SNEEZE_41 [Mycobacterium phage Sneeze]QBI96818.1 hypothetical protein SEA_RABBS_41 [Mycobacterium phage Rabbs]
MAANPARPGSDGRPWPGYTVRFCPVCRRHAGTHRAQVNDERKELVVYHQHDDTAGRPCPMGGKSAAIRAVAFTATDTGAPPVRGRIA